MFAEIYHIYIGQIYIIPGDKATNCPTMTYTFEMVDINHKGNGDGY